MFWSQKGDLMKIKIVLLITTFLFIYTALSFYIGWNIWVWLHHTLGFQSKWILGLCLGIISYSYVIGHFLKKWPFFKIIGSYWFAFFQYSILIFPFIDAIDWILLSESISIHSIMVWSGMIVLFLFAALFIYGTYNAYSPVVRTYSISIPKFGGRHSELRIAMASDMHFGTLSGLSHVHRLVKKVNQLHPDIILMPGDIIDDDPELFIRKKMGNIMKDLSAPLGVYGILGNHEYYGGGIPNFLKEMERNGITILQDQIVEIDKTFYLAGRKDKTDQNRLSIKDLLQNCDQNVPIIMMDHQPTDIKHAEENYVDILLSGHTHRGQLAPNHLFTKKLFELDWGYMQKSQLHTIVSSGFGFWGPPLRIGSRSEIVSINISFNGPETI
jgi:uncharacterized protein